MKTNELTGAALDWAVNQIEECCDDPTTPRFSTDWAQGGPIIERERLCVTATPSADWNARTPEYPPRYYAGPTPLIAAMRCFVASCLGDEVQVPEELK